MRHARDGATAAMNAASQVLAARGKAEPQEFDNAEVQWANRARDGVWAPVRGGGQRIHVGIDCPPDRAATVLRPSLRVFVGIDVDTDIVAQTTAEGVRFVTVLHGPEAPTFFRFPIGLAEGLALEAMPSGGFDVVNLRYGATVGRFYTPWACDALFRPIHARYELDNGAIVMRVPHDGAAYPVVADPHYGI
ncbi:hypothetical protein LO762_13480 [Actinocorallia sp. API 0066]|uniref:hypothetical protein n=1 Tax=Actinocorallia sp. API 0066 TaxID=2896846 RepID=UPI001E3DF599|nr:hypothetical protein [Actinocorallia sp. API 0066]MCD0450195.1 hypothetical protein [Actinocorallia sp. API 0066]